MAGNRSVNRFRNTGAIIQARMGSSRLPGKVMRKLLGRPMLEWEVERIRHSRLINRVIVATTTETRDNIISDFCRENSIDCFRGSEEDVLDRYYRAARRYNLDVVVRITSDCPLIDPGIIDRVIRSLIDNNCDYACNNFPPTFPDGLDTEVFTFDALERAWREADKPYQREHIEPYFYENTEIFRMVNVRNDKDLSWMRWTVDYEDDFVFITEIYRNLAEGNKIFLMEDILKLLEERPELLEINRGHIRNEWEIKVYGKRPYQETPDR
jgi:spore coat polysaccharide biosynthesis protein SpsF